MGLEISVHDNRQNDSAMSKACNYVLEFVCPYFVTAKNQFKQP